MPANNLNDSSSTSWMKKVHTQIAYNFHNESAFLRGVANITKNARTHWRDGKQSESPFQHRTVNLNLVLRNITLDDDTPVFTAACACYTGAEAGSTLVTSRRQKDILDLRAKILVNPVAWLNGWMFERLYFSTSLIEILFTGCDPEEVLLSIQCDFDPVNLTVNNPFEDRADEFVRLAEEDGIVMDLSALNTDADDDDEAQDLPAATDEEKVQADSPPCNVQAQRDAFAKRLRLKDDATFASQDSGAVSRVTGATANTSGAASFRSTTTADQNRDFRSKCLEAARLKAAQTSAASSIKTSKLPPPQPTSQGQPAYKGSAATTPKVNSTSANLPSTSKGGGARA
jgi:hypothetical protein